MSRQRLTARFVETVKPGRARREYFDENVVGLALRVSSSGIKSWVLFYRQHGRLRRWTIGRYPTLSLADARERARAGLRDALSGEDPARSKREAREATTFADLAERYLSEHAKPRKRSWREDARLLRRDVLPRWGQVAAHEIRRGDARELVHAVALRGAPIMANRLRALLHKVYAFAIEQEIVESNPIAYVPRPGVERRRDRVLSDSEIRHLWRQLDNEPPAVAAAFRLRLITAQRGGEVLNMRWSDIDSTSTWWTIPAEHSKNGLPHRVPLTEPAREIVASLRPGVPAGAEYVLTGGRGNRQQSEAAGRLNIPNFRGHDLRRTAASVMASAGIPRLVVAKVLNHAERDVTAVYDRHSYDAEKREALETWARRLSEILAPPTRATSVVSAEQG